MNQIEFEQFVKENEKDVLKFCQILTANEHDGEELYQNTMVTLLEKREQLDYGRNVKSFALSTSLFLYKNLKRKSAIRNKLAPVCSYEEYAETTGNEKAEDTESVEEIAINRIRSAEVRTLVSRLPEKYKMPIYLFYSAQLDVRDISSCLHLPESTVKTRLRRGKAKLKQELEKLGYE